jgi:hypothetical protein
MPTLIHLVSGKDLIVEHDLEDALGKLRADGEALAPLAIKMAGTPPDQAYVNIRAVAYMRRAVSTDSLNTTVPRSEAT